MTTTLDISNIDTSYDHHFEGMPGLTWLPWVGKRFGESGKKTLILGESTYNWAPDKEQVAERIKSKDHLRILHQNHALQVKRNSKYVRNVERAIFFSKSPKPEEIRHLWSSVVYHNLVLRPMATLKHRPNYNDYLLGWGEVLKLFRVLGIEQCLVYGLDKDKTSSLIETAKKQKVEYIHEKVTGFGRSMPSIVTLNIDGRSIKVFFVRHPSAFFSWKKWAGLLNEQKFTPI